MKYILPILLLISLTCSSMQVLTPSGYKDITVITPADSLVAYQVGTGTIVYNHLIGKEYWTVSNDPDHPALEYYTINGTWTICTLESIWRNADQVCHIFELQIGDTIFDQDNNNVIITSITTGTDSGWWRLQVTGDHSFIADGLTMHNAARYWSGNATPTSANWTYNTGGITNWGASSGVADNASVPASADSVIFDGAGAKGNANATVNTGTGTIKSLDMQAGYTGTLTLTNNLTVSGGTVSFAAGSNLIQTAGNFITATTITFNVPANKIFSISFGFGGTVTFNNDWETTSNVAFSTGGCTLNGSKTIKVGGNLTNGAVGGTCSLIMNGTGTWASASNFIFSVNITINTAGTITIGNATANSAAFGSGKTLTYLAGTVNMFNSSTTLYLNASATLNGWADISFSNITITNVTQTITIGNTLTINGVLTISGASVTFAGAEGWTASNFLINSTTAVTHTLQQGNTYTVTGAFTANLGGASARPKLVSSTVSTPVTFTLQNGATCYVGNFDATDINSSGGRTIWDWGPNVTLTRTTNWNNFSDIRTSSSAAAN